MRKKFKWGVIAPGRIAHAFAKGVLSIVDTEISAVASSSQKRADAFAEQYDIANAYDSYEALVADPDVDAVYISSLHHQHFAQAMLALDAGKPVLCEKPLTVNAAETKKLIEKSREKNLFLMEALWTRYLPIYGTVRQWLDDREIGDLVMMNATFGFRAPQNPKSRLLDPNLTGGALLDIGIYPLSVSQWVMGQNPKSFQVHALLGETGVDEMIAATLVYENGVISQFSSNIRSDNRNEFVIYGEKGHIRIHANFWGGTRATLNVNGKEETVIADFNATGFEYQTVEAMRCIQEDLLESPKMTHADTLATMTLMDDIRAEIGLKYPFE